MSATLYGTIRDDWPNDGDGSGYIQLNVHGRQTARFYIREFTVTKTSQTKHVESGTYEAEVCLGVNERSFAITLNDGPNDIANLVPSVVDPDPIIQGPPGKQGEKGDKGEQGERGPEGPRGPQGDPGERGLTGPTGPRGEIGVAGPVGPEGPLGAPPILSVADATAGESAAAWVENDPADPRYAYLHFTLPRGLQGVKGEPGPVGSLGIGSVIDGVAAEASIIGDAGDQYLNLTLPRGQQGPKGDKGDPYVPVDSDWISGATASGYSGTIKIRKVGAFVYIYFDIVQTTDTPSIGVLGVSYRPSSTLTQNIPVYNTTTGASNVGYLQIGQDGNMGYYKRTGTAALPLVIKAVMSWPA